MKYIFHFLDGTRKVYRGFDHIQVFNSHFFLDQLSSISFCQRVPYGYKRKTDKEILDRVSPIVPEDKRITFFYPCPLLTGKRN